MTTAPQRYGSPLAVALRHAVRTICATGTLFLLALSATPAQETHTHRPRRNDYAPTFSTLIINPPAKPKAGTKPKPATPVTQDALADAILADALRKVWTQTDKHWHQGEYSHIVNLMRLNAQGDPRNLDAYTDGAYLLWSMDRKPEAEALLQQGLRANPGNYYMYDEMGRYYYIMRKDYQAAIPYYEKAVKFKVPASTWNALANCYERAKQWDKAVKAWEVAATYPNNDVAKRRLERARNQVRKP
jgi:pentatricopeptide repeat protein